MRFQSPNWCCQAPVVIKNLYFSSWNRSPSGRFMMKIRLKWRQNPTKMASVWLALAPGRPERRKAGPGPAPAATGAPFGVPFPRHLAHGLSKGGPKGAKRPKRDWKKSIRKAIDLWRSKTLPKTSQNHAEMYPIFMFFQTMPKCPKLFVFQ